jgi:type I restriction enzyme S subunit
MLSPGEMSILYAIAWARQYSIDNKPFEEKMKPSLDWRPFEELFEIPIRNGLNRPTAVRGSGVKMVNMGELFAYHRIGDIPMDKVPLSPAEAQNYLLRKGDLLFARQSLVLSGAGKCSIFLGADESVTYEGHITRARLNREVADSTFYYYFFSSPAGRAVIESIVEQVAAAGIRGSDLAKLRVPYISLDEQHAIAHILGTLDDKIELNRRMNETLEAMARAIFKSWFVDFDPVRAKAEGRQPAGMDSETVVLFPDSFEDSPLGKIPRGWQTNSLYDIAHYINGAAYRDFDFSTDGSGLPNIKIAELKNGITAQTRFTNKIMDEKYQIEMGEILFSWSGSPETSLDAFIWSGRPGWLNQHIFKVVPSSSKERYFVYLLLRHLKSDLVEIARNKQTIGLGHVTVQDMKRLLVIRPGTTVAEAFAKVVEPLIEHMFNNELENHTLTALRDTLLPKLMSGEVRVKI